MIVLAIVLGAAVGAPLRFLVEDFQEPLLKFALRHQNPSRGAYPAKSFAYRGPCPSENVCLVGLNLQSNAGLLMARLRFLATNI